MLRAGKFDVQACPAAMRKGFFYSLLGVWPCELLDIIPASCLRESFRRRDEALKKAEEPETPPAEAQPKP